MPRKAKMTKEEIEKEINRQVEERLAISLKENNLKALKKYVEQSLNTLIYLYKYDDLLQSSMITSAIRLINSTDISEEDKEEFREGFAMDLVFMNGGVKEEDWEKAMNKKAEILKYLKGNY